MLVAQIRLHERCQAACPALHLKGLLVLPAAVVLPWPGPLPEPGANKHAFCTGSRSWSGSATKEESKPSARSLIAWGMSLPAKISVSK